MMQGLRLYYMVHANNLPSVIEHGILALNSLKKAPLLIAASKSIAHQEVNFRRDFKTVPNGRPLHDYVPLYFAYKTPMQYHNHYKAKIPQSLVVFLEMDYSDLVKIPGCFIADGNAANNETKIASASDQVLMSLDWKIINCDTCWSAEWKRKKMAELLVPEKISPNLIRRIVLQNADVARAFELVVKEIKTSFEYKAEVEVFKKYYY